MKHFGSSLRNIFFSIERGNREGYEQRKVVYNNMGWRSRALEFVPGPIKDFVSRGVNLVAGSGTHQAIEDKRGKGRGQAFQKKETKKERKARKRQEELEQGGWGRYVN